MGKNFFDNYYNFIFQLNGGWPQLFADVFLNSLLFAVKYISIGYLAHFGWSLL